jgi:hypothetical protein
MVMKVRALAMAALISGIAAVTVAYAHHSYAMYDSTKEVKLTGVVKSFQWTNPHSWIELVTDSGIWSVELGSPNILKRSGWSRDSLKPGDKATISINPLKDGTKGGTYLQVVLASGQTLGGVQ